MTRAVPSDSLRDGVLIYQCASATACPGGSVQGLSGSHSVPAGSYGLTPAELARIDPLHIGPNAAAVSYFRNFPSPNQEGRYPGNIDDFRFAAPVENTFRTYIARGDYRLSGSHSFFGRFNKQDDGIDSTPQYPGAAPGRSRADKNWGGAVGWDSTLGGNLVNTFRYGYTQSTRTRSGCATGTSTPSASSTTWRSRRPGQHQRPRHQDAQLRRRPVDGEGPPHLQVRRQHAVDPQQQLHLRQLVHDRQRQRLVGVGRRPALPAGWPLPGAGRLQRPACRRHGRPLGLRRFVDPAARHHQPDQRRLQLRRSTGASCRTALRWSVSTAPTSSSCMPRTAGTCATT